MPVVGYKVWTPRATLSVGSCFTESSCIVETLRHLFGDSLDAENAT